MNTFYRPGLVEMLLHGMFRRHSWFLNQYTAHDGLMSREVYCRICCRGWEEVVKYDTLDSREIG